MRLWVRVVGLRRVGFFTRAESLLPVKESVGRSMSTGTGVGDLPAGITLVLFELQLSFIIKQGFRSGRLDTISVYEGTRALVPLKIVHT